MICFFNKTSKRFGTRIETRHKSEIGNFSEPPHVGCYAGEMRADSLRAVADEGLRGFHVAMKRESFFHPVFPDGVAQGNRHALVSKRRRAKDCPSYLGKHERTYIRRFGLAAGRQSRLHIRS